MRVLAHDDQPLEECRDGVMTRMRMSAVFNGRQLCIFEQFCGPGLGAPTHVHAVEEVLEVVDGTAEVWIDDESAILRRNQSVLISAGARHGFRNAEGEAELHVRATLAACIFEASYDNGTEAFRRWSPHLAPR